MGLASVRGVYDSARRWGKQQVRVSLNHLHHRYPNRSNPYQRHNHNNPQLKVSQMSEQEEMSDQEGYQMLEALRQIAEEWRERLRDPVLASLIRSGKVQINPLVLKLLELPFHQVSQTQQEPPKTPNG